MIFQVKNITNISIFWVIESEHKTNDSLQWMSNTYWSIYLLLLDYLLTIIHKHLTQWIANYVFL